VNWLEHKAAARQAAGLQRSMHERRPGIRLVDIASNDYLGLSHDPRVVDAGVRALRTWGAGATGSRLVSGHTALHAELEASLAGLMEAESSLVFSSGYLANMAVLTALSDADTLVLSDSHNHASIIDACRLSRAHVQVYPNRDVDAVRRALADAGDRRVVVVTDAVFSVDGTLAPLAELAELTARASATLIVDEAHSLGVLGTHGAGACVAAGAAGPHVIRTFTLSKSLGSQGGGVAGDALIVDHLVNAARTFIFDTGLAPAAAGSALAAAEIVAGDPCLPGEALASTGRLAELAGQAGWPVLPHDAAVASAAVGSPEGAVLAQRVCRDHGVDVGCFRPPSVPDGVARLRMTGHAGMTEADYAAVGAALQAARAALPARDRLER
jgi:8-amino-7-oxononanoate synthase